MKRLTRCDLLKYGAAAAATTAAAGPAGIARAGRSKGGGTLIFSFPTESDIFDPHATGGWDTYKHTLQMFEGLTKEDLTNPKAVYPAIQPALAQSWDVSPDKLTYTFHLRKGVK